MNTITHNWGLETILECKPEAIVRKLEIKSGHHTDRTYQNIKEGTLEVIKGGLSIRANGTKQTWETFKTLQPGEVYQIYNDSKYLIMSIGDTEVIETKIPNLQKLADKVRGNYETTGND